MPLQSEADYKQAIDAAGDLEALDALRVGWLGKKGEITASLKELSSLPPEQKREAGQAINTLKNSVTEMLAARKAVLEEEALTAKLAAEALDLTLPASPAPDGRQHPISHTIAAIVDIFKRQGFDLALGPDVEDGFHNFTALNIPEGHPARQMHDTFYLEAEDQLLRTHTSPVQIRHLKEQQPPLRMLAAGRVYRADYDQTHTPMFHQIEGLVLEPGCHFGHLKGCLESFLAEFFGADVRCRWRPSYFPFTEPSAEVDIAFAGKSAWLEVLGCGMVHPEVLKHTGHDAATTQGFAFGLGVERLAMLKYGITDLRQFFHNDTRWLKHYGFAHWQVAA